VRRAACATLGMRLGVGAGFRVGATLAFTLLAGALALGLLATGDGFAVFAFGDFLGARDFGLAAIFLGLAFTGRESRRNELRLHARASRSSRKEPNETVLRRLV
jgi:hypothetical protein